MLPRGEVGLIFATIGLKEGVLGENLYASLLLVVLVTTLMAPPLLRWRLQPDARRTRRPRRRARADAGGGWLRVDDGVVDLAGDATAHAALTIGLDAALAIADGGAPGARLLDWLGALGDEPLRWDDDATQKLFEVLLARQRPRVALPRGERRARTRAARARRRGRPPARDPHLLDSSQVLRFELVERIRDLARDDPAAAAEHARLEHPEWLLLAALILDTAGEDAAAGRAGPPPRAAARPRRRGRAGDRAARRRLRAAPRGGAARVDGLDEESVLQLASHLERPERARALYLMSLALGELDAVERDAARRAASPRDATARAAGVTGLDARNLVEQRRAEAMRLVATTTGAQTGSRTRRGRTCSPRRAPTSPGRSRCSNRFPAATKPGSRCPARARRVGDRRRQPGPARTPRARVGRARRLRVRRPERGHRDLGRRRGARELPGARGRAPGPARPEALDRRSRRIRSRSRPRSSRRSTQPLDVAAEPRRRGDASTTPARPGTRSARSAAPTGAGCCTRSPSGSRRPGASVHSARLDTVDGLAVDRFELTDRDRPEARPRDQGRGRGTRSSDGVSPRRRRFAAPLRV